MIYLIYYLLNVPLIYIGIILCELIARMGADPDVLPRTSNFGVDYIAFSAICPDCPPDFIQLTFNCVRVSKLNGNFLRSARGILTKNI